MKFPAWFVVRLINISPSVQLACDLRDGNVKRVCEHLDRLCELDFPELIRLLDTGAAHVVKVYLRSAMVGAELREELNRYMEEADIAA